MTKRRVRFSQISFWGGYLLALDSQGQIWVGEPQAKGKDGFGIEWDTLDSPEIEDTDAYCEVSGAKIGSSNDPIS